MKKITTIAIMFCLIITVQAQELTKNLTPKNQQLGFFMGFYGNQLHDPGVQIGVEDYLATTLNYQIIGSMHLVVFGKNNLYYAIALTPRIGLRYTSIFGLTFESHFGIGYVYRHFNYHQYEINATGDIDDKGNAGLSSMMPNLAIGLGYDFSRKINLPVKLYIRPSCGLSLPAGHILFEAYYGLEAGLIYAPTINCNKTKY
jgi:hypothetical protein